MNEVLFKKYADRPKLVQLQKVALATLLSVGAFVFTARPAAADLTIASTVTMEQTTLASGTHTTTSGAEKDITLYSHADKARTEIAGGPTTLFDKDNVYVLDDNAKTYYKEALKDWLGFTPTVLVKAVASEPQSNVDVDTKLTFDKTDDLPGNWQTLAGFNARKYLVTGWINVSPKSQGRDGQGGGFGGRHGGIFGGGGMGIPMAFPEGSSTASPLRTVQFGGGYSGRRHRGGQIGGVQSTSVSADIWLTKSVGFVGDKANSEWADALVSSWGVGRLTDDLASAIAKERGLPLLANITLTWSENQPESGQTDPNYPPEETDSVDQTSVTASVNITSVSESPVAPSLFSIPPDFTQVSAPTATPDAQQGNPNTYDGNLTQ